MRDSCLAATSKYVIIHVEPFLPDLVKTVFKSYCPNFSGDDLLALYAFTGGVAQYIQNFLPMGAFTLEDMLQLGVEENSVWLSEAQLMLTSEFKGSAQTYHEILRRIAPVRTNAPNSSGLSQLTYRRICISFSTSTL